MRRRRYPSILLALAVLLGARAEPTAAGQAPLRALVGETIMTAFDGTALDADLLARMRRGEIGGLIVYGSNYVSAAQLRHVIDTAQAAARAGGNPPLLVAADQEGGPVRRLPHAAPALSARAMARLGPAKVEAQGRFTAQALRA